jgi:hypothetical protein
LIAWACFGLGTASCGGISRDADRAPGGGGDTGVAGGNPGTAGTPNPNGGSPPGTAGAPAGGSPQGSAGGPPEGFCALGNPCSIEGSRCANADADACCVGHFTCVGGVWSNPSYEECGGVVCPAIEPTVGTACGPCPGSCTYDTCSADGGGKNLGMNCENGRWTPVDLGCLTCCKSDTDCPAGFCATGRCEASDHGDGCFRDQECGKSQMCSGARICPCGDPALCRYGDRAGVCVPLGAGCCATDADCGPKQACIAGVCKAAAPADHCWRDEECEFGCSPATVCPCGASCFAPDQPGTCWIPL